MNNLLAKTKRAASGCLEYQGSRSPAGYGLVRRGRGKTWLAHRYVWASTRGPIPDGMLVCHRCDNPSCVDIEHLFLGTHKENTADMLRKGRCRAPRRTDKWRPGVSFGMNNKKSKLTWDQVKELRHLYAAERAPSTALAAHYGISTTAALAIIHRQHRVHA